MKKGALKVFMAVLILVAVIETVFLGVYAENTTVIVDSPGIVLSVSPKMVNGETYVPVRPVLESLGWELNWNSDDRAAISTKGESKIILKIGSIDASINGKQVTLDNPPIVIDGITYIQSKFIAQQFGVKIRWNKKDNLIIISGEDTKNTIINGEGNIIIVGNGIILNIFEPYSMDTAYDIINYADSLLSNNYALDALQKYKEVLENISEDENSDIYAHIMSNMGNAYAMIAETRDMKENILCAIASYKEALKIYTYNTVNYSITLNNLGNAYKVLSEVTGDTHSLRMAIDKYKEALRFYLPEKNTLEYASIQYNMGTAYMGLGYKNSSKESLLKAKETYEAYLELYSEKENPIKWALIQYNLGNIYKVLSTIADTEENLLKAKIAYEEALKIRTIETYPLDYARINKCLGDIFKALSKTSNAQYNLGNAITEYKESLKFFPLERYPVDYARVNYEIGNVYMLMAGIKDGVKNLSSAKEALKEALKVFNASDYPVYNKLVTDCVDKINL